MVDEWGLDPTCAGRVVAARAGPLVAATRGRARRARDRRRAAGAQPPGRACPSRRCWPPRWRVRPIARSGSPHCRRRSARSRPSPRWPAGSARCPDHPADLRSLLRAGELVGRAPRSRGAAPVPRRPGAGRARSPPRWPRAYRSSRSPCSASRSVGGGRCASVARCPPVAADRRRPGRAGRSHPRRAAAPRHRHPPLDHLIATPPCQPARGRRRTGLADSARRVLRTRAGRPVPVRCAGTQLPWAVMAFATAADGTRLHYEVFGARHGEPLLLIQGLGADSRGWLRQRRALSGRFRCIVFDNRGAGRSDHPPGALRPRGHGRRRPGRARRGRRGPGPRDGRVDGRHHRPGHRRAAPRAGPLAGAGLHRVPPPRVAPGAAGRVGRRGRGRRHGLVRPHRRALADRSSLAAPVLAGGRAWSARWP